MNYASPALVAQYWSDMQQSAFLQQLLAANGTVWLQIVLMVTLFWLIAYKHDRIRHPHLMRWSYILLVASLVVPLLLNLLIGGFVSTQFFAALTQYSNMRRGEEGLWLLQASTMMGPILLAVSLCLGFSSLALGPTVEESRKSKKPVVPQKHPLD